MKYFTQNRQKWPKLPEKRLQSSTGPPEFLCVIVNAQGAFIRHYTVYMVQLNHEIAVHSMKWGTRDEPFTFYSPTMANHVIVDSVWPAVLLVSEVNCEGALPEGSIHT